jgi:hypothetical protein
MRFTGGFICMVAIAFAPALTGSTSRTLAQAQGDTSRAVTDGGVFAPGWSGKIDANEEKNGAQLSNAKLTQEGNVLKVTTGPAVTYWNPKNVASGTYTVKATFNEPKYMNLNSHPHPYGIVVAGNDMGTPQASYLYCAAYGNGTFIVRGFGPDPFQMGGRRGAPAPSVNKATGPGDRRVSHGRRRQLRDQWDGGRDLSEGRGRRSRQVEVDGRGLRHSVRAQH